jgi:large subunit ribosomal protein L13
MLTQKTKVTKASDITRKWYIVDAEGQILGRLATRVAGVLMGKGKPLFTKNLDCGDHVVVINAEKVRVTGNKMKQKTYYRHTGYVGGIKSVTLEKQLQEKPAKVITDAVYGMVPKNKLGRKMLTKLKVYRGAEHPHAAQQPERMPV